MARTYKRDKIGRFAETNGGGGSWMSAIGDKMAARYDRPAAPSTPVEDVTARGERVGKIIGTAMKTMSTDKTHVTESGAWTPERDRVHREIAAELYEKAAHVPNNRQAVIAGGLGGAGKTTVLKGYAGIDPDDYLTINPDDVKEVMAERGLIPEVPGHPDLSPMERAALVHEESSRIAALMADRAYREGKNMMWDITMSSDSSVRKRVDALKASGYRSIAGVFVDIPVEVSVERAMFRYGLGVEDHRAGKGFGGRYVPPEIIRAQRTSTGETVNRGVFDKLKMEFTEWSMYDNSVNGRAPKLMKKRSAPGAGDRAFQAAASAPALPPPGVYAEWPAPPIRRG